MLSCDCFQIKLCHTVILIPSNKEVILLYIILQVGVAAHSISASHGYNTAHCMRPHSTV